MSQPIKPTFKLVSRGAAKRLGVLALLSAAALLWCHCTMIRMPGKSFQRSLPPLTDSQTALSNEVRRDVEMLGGKIGRRNIFYSSGYRAAQQYIERELQTCGFDVRRQTFKVQGVECANVEVEIPGSGSRDEIIIIGAHYDSVDDSPAANDNASGVAATLALARRFGSTDAAPPVRTLRFVFFANEEPPCFMTRDMGSLVYATRSKEQRENIIAMVSLETIGYFSDQPGSQTYPIKPVGWFYPNTGNFIGFVGNYHSRSLVRAAIGTFREHAKFPSEGAALPDWIEGVSWSDQWSFWQQGYRAIMVTDTAPFRYPWYHTEQDTPDKLDYDRMARVVEGLQAVVDGLAHGK